MTTRSGITMLRVLLLLGGFIAMSGCGGGSQHGAPVASEPSRPDAPRVRNAAEAASGAVSCEGISPWESTFATVNGGDLVTNRGSLYECTPGGTSAWCRQDVYEPGTDDYYPPPDWWPQAWTLKGTCGGGSQIRGNFLTIVLPPAPAGQRATAADKPITGVLRCPLQPGNDTAIAGDWGESVTIDDLPPCNYELIVNAVGGYRPETTPAVIAISEPQGQEVRYAVTFAPPFPIDKLKALPGLTVEEFAHGLIQPRQMAMGKNVLYVGSSAIPQYVGNYGDIAGFVYALPLDPATQRPTGELYLVATKQIEPHGVAYRNGKLYFATTGTLYRLDDADTAFHDPHPVEVLSFPADDARFALPVTRSVSIFRRWHQKHPLYFDPAHPDEERIYTAIGRPCNQCDMAPKDDRYGSLMSYDLTTGIGQVLATGIRNAVGMDWDPATHDLWFTDNNRQTTGQDPITAVKYPDELNRFSTQGENFGTPNVYGRATIGYTTDEFSGKTDPNAPTGMLPGIKIGATPPAAISPAKFVPASLELAPGAAPLGVKFIGKATYPGTGDGQSLVFAAHGAGSDNDGSPDVRVANVAADHTVSSVWSLVTGWQQPDALLGRPVDFLVLADGSVLISDDAANVIYRVSYNAAALPDTAITLHMAASPSATIKDTPPHGVLVDHAGTRWPFTLAWSASTTVKGFAPGSYRVEMADIADYTPVKPSVDVSLAAGTPGVVDIAYAERPPVQASVTLTAPARPEGADVTAQMDVTIVTDGKVRTVAVPWGGKVDETWSYGNHEVVYPYMPHAIPEPSRHTVRVQDGTAVSLTTGYHVVASIGQAMLGSAVGSGPGNGGCRFCHDDGLAGNPGIAKGWAAEGQVALRSKILDMSKNVENGHCDTTCATQIAAYLFDDVWKAYLEPEPSFGTRHLRKLSRQEYVRSVADLFGVAVDAAFLPSDAPTKYFVYPGQASTGIFDESQVKAYYDEALRVAAAIDPATVGYTAGGDDGAFVDALGHRVFRRALTAEEKTRYLSLLTGTYDDGMDGLRRLVAGFVTSPNFLYRSELGEPVQGQPDIWRLTPDEVATALSFGYLGTTPDAALLKTAEGGGLETAAQVDATIDAMLATEAGKNQFLAFIRYYTRTTLPPAEKEGLDSNLSTAMWNEQAMFVRDVVGKTSATVQTLFNPGFTYLNQSLAEHYGIKGVTGDAMSRVTLDAADSRRWGGLLQQGAFLASRAASDANVTSLVRRGFTVRENLLCRQFATAENDNQPVAYPDRPVGMREHWNLRTLGTPEMPRTCWSCHQFVNDLGASMEHYDQTARFRTEEPAVNEGFHDQMVAIDAAGPLVSNGGTMTWVNFNDVRDVSQYLPKESQAMHCFADSYYRFLYGEESGTRGAKLVNDVAKQLTDTGSLYAMFHALGSADAMRLRKQQAPATRTVAAVPADAPVQKRASLHWRTPNASSAHPETAP